jgi:hypothetical protein
VAEKKPPERRALLTWVLALAVVFFAGWYVWSYIRADSPGPAGSAAASASPIYSMENGVPSEKSPASMTSAVVPFCSSSARVFLISAARRAIPPILTRALNPAPDFSRAETG